MSDRTLELYLDDILGAIEKIEAYVGPMTKEQFDRDEKTIDAVIRNIETIGEAARSRRYPKIERRN